jgi:hypothetical protein
MRLPKLRIAYWRYSTYSVGSHICSQPTGAATAAEIGCSRCCCSSSGTGGVGPARLHHAHDLVAR